MEQSACEGDSRKRCGTRSACAEQRHTDADPEENVPDLAYAAECEQTLRLLLPYRVHGPCEESDRPENANQETPSPHRIFGGSAGRYEPEEVSDDTVSACLDHDAGQHRADGRRGCGVGIWEPDLPKRPHAHLDPEANQEEEEG